MQTTFLQDLEREVLTSLAANGVISWLSFIVVLVHVYFDLEPGIFGTLAVGFLIFCLPIMLLIDLLKVLTKHDIKED
jgi:ABC-type Fe3+-siderophore transport system permease subunit